MMKHRSAMGALALALAMAGTAQAGTVSGKFVLDGKALEPSDVAAFRIRSQSDARQVKTYVMLTTAPVEKEKIGNSLSPYSMAINDPAARGDYLALEVASDGEVGMNAHIGGTQFIDSSGEIMGEKGALTATCKENTPTRVACTVKSANPVKSADGSGWNIDVTFETDVTARPAGKPIAAGGDAPGKALLALSEAIKGDDLAKILALLSESEGKSYREDWRTPEENLQSAKDILAVRVPKQPKVTGGEMLADDHAVLEVEGVPFEGARMLYLVEMRKVDGNWVLADASSEGLLR